MNSSCQTPTAPLNPSPVIQLNSASTNVPVVPALPPVPPPPVPPPPPPPPPVPPPPQTSVFTEKKNMVKRHPENCKLQQNPLVKKDAPVSVTLQDLLNVKLRKTDSPTTKVKAFSPSKRRIPLITMSDLQKVTLRSSQSDIPNKFGKTHLKSPGGTPLYEKENKESGSGLTPIMTQALRRKFQYMQAYINMANKKGVQKETKTKATSKPRSASPSSSSRYGLSEADLDQMCENPDSSGPRSATSSPAESEMGSKCTKAKVTQVTIARRLEKII
ncbi:PRR11 protein, partial [Polypterus senegalus]